jgi:serine O-acetyltransferase
MGLPVALLVSDCGWVFCRPGLCQCCCVAWHISSIPLNFFFFGIEIAVQCRVGKGLFLPHTQGTVIGAYSIGENATIFQGVTLGARELDFSFIESSRPAVGNDVTIGSGAKVLGGLTVGSGSRIGANAVVLESIPANVAAAGVPARVTKSLL